MIIQALSDIDRLIDPRYLPIKSGTMTCSRFTASGVLKFKRQSLTANLGAGSHLLFASLSHPSHLMSHLGDSDGYSADLDLLAAKLQSHEVFWSSKQVFLESRGYMLRQRLRPGWVPSWIGTSQNCIFAEDFHPLPVGVSFQP